MERFCKLAFAIGVIFTSQPGGVRRSSAIEPPMLKVSENRRFLVDQDEKPFFWLGDTAWELFHRLNREEALHYLDVRRDQGFNVVQAVALAELDGLRVPNAYGHLPLIENDPTRPWIVDGAENDYWDHVDFIIKAANDRGMLIGLLPTWGDKWNKKWGVGPEIFDAQNAERYGRWIGERYRDAGVVWILGGDRPIDSDNHAEIIRAMAKGIRAAVGERQLITFHPTGGSSSSDPFHFDTWLNFNMRQNGHVAEFNDRYQRTFTDYSKTPVKPVIDGEPIYEDHPISFDALKLGHSVASDVRRPLYWDLFSGAFGHTYGHHSVWQMWSSDRDPINNPLMDWREAIEQPGAKQMIFGKRLLESRPFLTRVPDLSILVPDRIPTAVPGAGRYHFVATRDSDGTYAMIYVPIGRTFRAKMNVIRNPKVKAWWYDPRNGKAEFIGVFSSDEERDFISPSPGEDADWVLVLDDDSKGYPPPGTVD